MQQLYIKVAVFAGLFGLIPYPNKVSAAGGVEIPIPVVRFDHYGMGTGQLFLCKFGRRLAVFLYFAGGFRRIYADKAGLQHAGGHYAFRHEEMHGVAVHERLYRNLLLRCIRARRLH